MWLRATRGAVTARKFRRPVIQIATQSGRKAVGFRAEEVLSRRLAKPKRTGGTLFVVVLKSVEGISLS